MKEIEPLGNRVLIQAIKMTETAGGIFMPGNINERFCKGEVLAVGPGEVCGTNENRIVLKKVSVQPGDAVLYDSTMGIDVGDDKFLVNDHDLQCKYVETKAADVN